MEEKEMDEYNRSKIDRRNEGKDEQTFEEWKKEKEDIKKAEEEERKKKEEKERKDREERERKEREERKKVRAAAVDDDLYKPNRSRKETKEKVEIDEEDEGNLGDLRGYKKTSDGRTTSYFNNELDEHTKSLIGNITPKRIDSVGSLDTAATPGVTGMVSRNDSTASTNSNSSSGGASASVWNTAGTWEEKDMSADVKSRLTELCQSVCTNAAKIKDVKTIEGDAQIVIARGKKRHIYDYNIKLEFEACINESVTTSEGDVEEKTSKYKGTFVFPEVSPISSYDCQVSFKKTVPAYVKIKVESAVEELKSEVISTFKRFDDEYKAM